MRIVFKGKLLITAVAVFVLLIFLYSIGIINPAEKFILNFFAPVEAALFNIGQHINISIEKIAAKENKNELALLRAQIRKLLIQNAQLKILSEENELLKKELNFTRKHNYELVAARIIGYDSLMNSDLLILQIEDEKYEISDISPDMPIIIEDGILVGKISEIRKNIIFMRPVTSPQNAVAATILNKNYTLAVAEGEFNFGIRLRMIPQTEKIKQGDLVISSGLELKMPKGLLIGTVSNVERDSQSPFNIARAEPLYDQKKLSKILIIKSY